MSGFNHDQVNAVLSKRIYRNVSQFSKWAYDLFSMIHKKFNQFHFNSRKLTIVQTRLIFGDELVIINSTSLTGP